MISIIILLARILKSEEKYLSKLQAQDILMSTFQKEFSDAKDQFSTIETP